MKATGIVRRIDDLGRVVIPKELREGVPPDTTLARWQRFRSCIESIERRR